MRGREGEWEVGKYRRRTEEGLGKGVRERVEEQREGGRGSRGKVERVLEREQL